MPPFNPLTVRTDPQTHHFFDIVPDDDVDNIDNGNVMGTLVYNSTNSHGTVSFIDEYGQQQELLTQGRQSRDVLVSRIRKTGTNPDDIKVGIPWSTEYPKPRLTTPPDVEITAGSDHIIDLDDTDFFEFIGEDARYDFILTWSVESSDDSVATVSVTQAANVVTVSGVATGTAVITISGAMFSGVFSVRFTVTVT